MQYPHCWVVSLSLCCTWLGWGGSWRIVLVGSPAQDLPNSLQLWGPLVLVSLCVPRLSSSLSRPLSLCLLWGWHPITWSKAMGILICRGSVEQGDGYGSSHDLGIIQHNWGTILGFAVLNITQVHCGTLMGFLCKGKLVGLLFLLQHSYVFSYEGKTKLEVLGWICHRKSKF